MLLLLPRRFVQRVHTLKVKYKQFHYGDKSNNKILVLRKIFQQTAISCAMLIALLRDSFPSEDLENAVYKL